MFRIKSNDKLLRQKYKLNLKTPEWNQVTLKATKLKEHGSEIWSSLLFHIKSSKDLNVCKGPMSGMRQFLTTESPLKLIENVSYFMLGAFFVLELFTFFLDFLVMYKNGLTIRLRLIPKFMTSQTGQQIMTIHVLPNISRSKDNQTMKYGPLIWYNMRSIFLQKLCRK